MVEGAAVPSPVSDLPVLYAEEVVFSVLAEVVEMVSQVFVEVVEVLKRVVEVLEVLEVVVLPLPPLPLSISSAVFLVSYYLSAFES